ncbi:uncharacterized protein DS421_18g602480 [Arachis hypogaea]|nr:uncharacterized protein DS421_18g602480 [Arachis hypogaea]
MIIVCMIACQTLPIYLDPTVPYRPNQIQMLPYIYRGYSSIYHHGIWLLVYVWLQKLNLQKSKTTKCGEVINFLPPYSPYLTN